MLDPTRLTLAALIATAFACSPSKSSPFVILVPPPTHPFRLVDEAGQTVATGRLSLPALPPAGGEFRGTFRFDSLPPAAIDIPFTQGYYTGSVSPGDPASPSPFARYPVHLKLPEDVRDAGILLLARRTGDHLTGVWYRERVSGGHYAGTFQVDLK